MNSTTPRLAGSRSTRAKPGELLAGSGDAGDLVAQVALHDLGTGRSAPLLSTRTDTVNGSSVVRFLDAEVRVREGRVRQAVAERVQRRRRRVDVVAEHLAAAAAGAVVVVDRDLARVARDRDRQPSARVDVAAQHVGEPGAALFARAPRVHERGGVALASHGSECTRPLSTTTTTGLPERDERLRRASRCAAGQVEIRAVAELAARVTREQPRRPADAADDDVGVVDERGTTS